MVPSITLSTHQQEEEEQEPEEVVVGEVEMIKAGESRSTGREVTTDLHHHRTILGSTSRRLTSNIPLVPATQDCR